MQTPPHSPTTTAINSGGFIPLGDIIHPTPNNAPPHLDPDAIAQVAQNLFADPLPNLVHPDNFVYTTPPATPNPNQQGHVHSPIPPIILQQHFPDTPPQNVHMAFYHNHSPADPGGE